MKILSQDAIVVNVLKRILEDYKYLEHNESKKYRNENFLHVDVIGEKPDCANMDRIHIVGKLEQSTGRFLGVYDPGPRDSGRGDMDKQWTYFRIRERKKT